MSILSSVGEEVKVSEVESRTGMRRFRAAAIPKPREWKPFVAPAMPLDVEVGCGVGFHPLRYASSHLDRYLIAIEHTRTRFQRFEGRVRNHPPFPNLLPVHADAVEWITHQLSTASVEKYFFLYPNPYPKARDQNKRWHAMPFMERVLDTLKPGGTLTLATNERFYFDEARDYLTRVWRLEILEESVLTRADLPPGYPRTHFEKKYLERGQSCFNGVFGKR